VGRPPTERRRRLSPAALTVTHQKVRKAYSPIVIAGAVRVADFVLISLVGVALYLGYVVPISGFHWEYVAAIFGMTADRGALLPGRRYLRSPGVSRTAAADDADDFVMGIRVPAVYRRVVLPPNSAVRYRGSGWRRFLCRTGRADGRTAVSSRAGARLGA